MSFPSRSLRVSLLALAALTAFHAGAVTLTRDNGAPVGDDQNSQTAGPTAGPAARRAAHPEAAAL